MNSERFCNMRAGREKTEAERVCGGRFSDLASEIAQAIDKYHARYPGLTIGTIRAAVNLLSGAISKGATNDD